MSRANGRGPPLLGVVNWWPGVPSVLGAPYKLARAGGTVVRAAGLAWAGAQRRATDPILVV